MNMAELIAALQRGEDPSTAIPGAFAASAAGGPGLAQTEQFPFPPPPAAPPAAAPVPPPPEQAQAQAPPPPSGPPVGVATPLTNPQPKDQAPSITQSPPDLANMYIELMKKNQNARAMDSGLTLMASALSPYAQTRQGLIALAGKEEAGKMGLSAADIINFQKQGVEMQQRALRQRLLPALAKEHRLTPETIAALEASGKLDEVLQNFATKGLTHIKNDATGETVFFNRHGERVASAGGGLKPTDDQAELAAYNAQRPPEQRLDMAQWLSTVKREAPGAADRAMLAAINAERPADRKLTMEQLQTEIKREPPAGADRVLMGLINQERALKGEPPITTEEYLAKYKHRQPSSVTVTPDGVPVNKPEPGFEWMRNPNNPKELWVDPVTKLPKQVAVGERAQLRLDQAAATTEHTEATTEKTQAEIDKLRKDAEERLKKEGRERVAQAMASSHAGNAIDKALINADKPGASGFLSRPARYLPFGGLPSDALDSNLKTIDATNAVAALTAMRNASQTGAGLGSVSDFENKMLASTIANLSPFQPTSQLKENLIRIKASLLVMAENKYENESDGPRFHKDLRAKIDELTSAEIERTTATKGRPGDKVIRLPRE